MPSSQGPMLPADWALVLDQIQQGLERAVDAAAERERALEPAPPDNLPPPERRAPADGLEARVRLAEEQAARVDAQLEASVREAQRWLTSAAALRGRLANEAPSGVS